MNTRRRSFADWRVREALIHAFNFEFINDTMTGGQQPRITSYFSNSPLGMTHGPAEGGCATSSNTPTTCFPARSRDMRCPRGTDQSATANHRGRALDLLASAGWTVQDGVMRNADGEPLPSKSCSATGASEDQAIIDMYVQSLERIGVTPTVSTVDSAQYKERTDGIRFRHDLFPPRPVTQPGQRTISLLGQRRGMRGSRNLMGMSAPAVDGDDRPAADLAKPD